jgi:hypothetical protein
MNAPYEITAVEHLGGHRLRLTFADGFIGDVDLADRFEVPIGPMFEPLRDVSYFARVVVDPELGTVVWPNGADLAPDVLHQEALSLA